MEYDLMSKERMINELSLIADSAPSNLPPRNDESSEPADETKIVNCQMLTCTKSI